MGNNNNKQIFNWKQYLCNYEDLRKAGIIDEKAATRHWFRYGISERRTDKSLINNVVEQVPKQVPKQVSEQVPIQVSEQVLLSFPLPFPI